MKEIICERGGKCIYLEKDIMETRRPLFPKSEKTVSCNTLMLWCGRTKPSKQIKKFKNKCKHKQTKRLTDYAK